MKEQFSFTGRVIAGHHLGHTLGFPTANIVVTPGERVPAFGVYAAWVTLPDGSRRAAVTDLGVRPAVEKAGALWLRTAAILRDHYRRQGKKEADIEKQALKDALRTISAALMLLKPWSPILWTRTQARCSKSDMHMRWEFRCTAISRTLHQWIVSI